MSVTLLIDAALCILGITMLWLGARWLVGAGASLARGVGIPPLLVGLTIVAFGTSAPEIAVSVGSAFDGRGNVSVGNVVGSNIFNIGVILGLLALYHPFRVSEKLVRRDAVIMVASTVFGVSLLLNSSVSRLEGAVLFLALLVYLGWLGSAASRAVESQRTDGGRSDPPTEADSPTSATGPSNARETERPRWLEAVVLVVGLVLVGAGGRLLVDGAVGIALAGGVSEWVIGVTIVAVGTSLPEGAASVVAIRRNEVGIAAGNLVGSNVFNVLGVLGLSALVRPVSIAPGAFLGLVWVLVLTGIGALLLATGRRLTRLEGAVLIAAVVCYWILSAIV